MLDPCGPEMTAIFMAIVRGILLGVSLGGLAIAFDALRRRVLGEVWRYDRDYTPAVVTIVTMITLIISVAWEMYKQFG